MDAIMNGISYLLTNWMTGWMGMLLYWLPLSICVVGYTIRTFENYQKDVAERDKYTRYLDLKAMKSEDGRTVDARATCYYSPTDTIGTLIGRALISLLPVGNLWAAMFDVSPRLFKKFFDFIEKVFDMPLVPRPTEKS